MSDAPPPAPPPPAPDRGVTSLLEVVEGGVQKVGMTLVMGTSLVLLGLWLWPRGSTVPDGGAEGDFQVHLWRQLETTSAPLEAGASVPSGARVRLWVDAPFTGTFALVEPGTAGKPVMLWPASGEPERTSAGKRIEVGGELEVAGAAGPRAWVATLCRLGAQAPACDWSMAATPRCPEGCLVTRLSFSVAP